MGVTINNESTTKGTTSLERITRIVTHGILRIRQKYNSHMAPKRQRKKSLQVCCRISLPFLFLLYLLVLIYINYQDNQAQME